MGCWELLVQGLVIANLIWLGTVADRLQVSCPSACLLAAKASCSISLLDGLWFSSCAQTSPWSQYLHCLCAGTFSGSRIPTWVSWQLLLLQRGSFSSEWPERAREHTQRNTAVFSIILSKLWGQTCTSYMGIHVKEHLLVWITLGITVLYAKFHCNLKSCSVTHLFWIKSELTYRRYDFPFEMDCDIIRPANWLFTLFIQNGRLWSR